ncbi:hypothetical protein EJB05_34387, partial [Eragrostis curvula]
MEEVPDAIRRKKGVIDKLPFKEHTNTASNGTNAVIREFSSPGGRKDGVYVSSGKEKKENALLSGGKENKPPATPWSKTPEYRRQYQAQYRAKRKAELSTPGAHCQSKLISSASEILDLTIVSSVIPGDVKLTGESTVVQGEPQETLIESAMFTPFLPKTSPVVDVVSNSPSRGKTFNTGKPIV